MTRTSRFVVTFDCTPLVPAHIISALLRQTGVDSGHKHAAKVGSRVAPRAGKHVPVMVMLHCWVLASRQHDAISSKIYGAILFKKRSVFGFKKSHLFGSLSETFTQAGPGFSVHIGWVGWDRFTRCLPF